MPSSPRFTSLLGLLALLLVATGCPKPPSVTDPSIDRFEASATTITAGGTVTLSWETSNALAVTMVDGADQPVDLAGAPAAAGSVDLTLDAVGSHTFTLTATGEEESSPATASVTLTVEASPAPVITSLTATPASVALGDPASLSWTTTGADTVSMVDDAGNTLDLAGQGAASGTVSVTPAVDTTYTLTASGPGGSTTATVTVTVFVLPTILTFESDAAGAVVAGSPVVLSWTTTDTDSIALVDDAGNAIDVSALSPTSDSVTVTPLESSTFTLTATNANGSTDATVTVEVLTHIIAFTLSPEVARAGDTLTLAWQIGGATAADLSGPGGFSYAIPAGELLAGSTTLSAATAGDFVLSATGPQNSDSATRTLAITTAPRIRTFTATPDALTEGEATTLAWTVDGADALDLTDSLGNTVDISALSVTSDSVTQTLVVPGTVTYTLTATNADGNHVLTADVLVAAHPSIDTFVAVPSRLPAGDVTLLSWTTSAADSVRLEESTVDLGIPATDLDGSHQTGALAADTTYVLYASNAAGHEASASLTVTIGAPVNTSFTATPGAGAPGATLQLGWTNEGGTTLTISDGTTDVCTVSTAADVAAGTCDITAPAAVGTHTFTLTVTDSQGGSDTATLDLRVSDGPIIQSFEGNAALISEGDTLTLSWLVDDDPAGNTPSLNLTDDQGNTYDLSGLDPNAGSGDLVGLAAGTYVFTLAATTGVGTDASASFTVTVVAMPVILTFGANPDALDTLGGTVVPTTDLGWTTLDGVSAELWELDATGAPILPALHVAASQGEVDAHTLLGHPLTFSTTFRLHVENAAGGAAEADLTVMVDGPQILAFEATLGGTPVSEVVAGELIDLTWTTNRADAVTLDPPPVRLTSGQYQDISATGTMITFSDPDMGEALITFPAGFTFPYYGSARTQVVATSDGFLSFDPAVSSTGANDPFPHPSSPHGGVIAAFWDDLDLPVTGHGYTLHQVNAGGPDAFIISWQGTQLWNEPTTDLNFQIVLWDDGSFAVNYGTMSGPGADGDVAAAGFEDDTGTRGVQFFRNEAWPGGLTGLGWQVDAAVPVSGSVQVTPTGDTTYTLTATSAAGTSSSGLGLIVHPPAQVLSTGVSTVFPEETFPFDLTWTTRDATRVVVTDAGGNVRCTVTDPGQVLAGTCALSETTAGTYTYTVTATGALPRDTTATVQTVTIWPLLEINSFTISDGSVTDPVQVFVSAGTGVTLSWDVSGAVGFSLVSSVSGDLTPASWTATGTLSETPTQTTTYTLSISDHVAFAAGSRVESHQVTVYVDAARIDSYGASATQVAPGTSVDLSWTTSGIVDNTTLSPLEVQSTIGNSFASIVGAAGAIQVVPVDGGGSPDYDGGNALVTLPGFPFPFDGQVFTEFAMNANGILFLDPSVGTGFHTSHPIPDVRAPNGGLIAPYWDDLDGTAGVSGLWYQLTGVPGSQTLILEWASFTHYWNGGTLTFQLVLQESGAFEVRYLAITENGSSGVVGFESISGESGYALVSKTAAPGKIAAGAGHLFRLDVLPASGTTTVTPTRTTTYELCATGGGYTDCQTVTIVVIQPGDLLINELMLQPQAATGNGEWFELLNQTAEPIDIEGWTLRDGGGQSTLIANGGPLLVPAGGVLLLAAEASPALNGGVTPAYAYGSGLSLDLPTDDLVIEFGGTIIDTVTWDGTWPFTPGASLAFVSAGGGDQSVNDLPAAWMASLLPYGAGDLGSPGTANFRVLLAEDFEVWPLTGWTIEDGSAGGGPDGFTWGECTSGRTLVGSSGAFACADSDAAGNLVVMDEGLVSPSLDASGASNVTLLFTHFYNWYLSDEGRVEVSTDGGQSYTVVATYTADSTNGERVQLDLSTLAAGQADVRVRFHYSADYDWYWLIDDVRVLAY
ncbi:MAG: lamin tail domain-containing protein [Deltaproteobacteria bacterium]|nr:lamin tail domain-containing protein [Deltaproteobacteria bacterium]